MPWSNCISECYVNGFAGKRWRKFPSVVSFASPCVSTHFTWTRETIGKLFSLSNVFLQIFTKVQYIYGKIKTAFGLKCTIKRHKRTTCEKWMQMDATTNYSQKNLLNSTDFCSFCCVFVIRTRKSVHPTMYFLKILQKTQKL